MKKIVQSVAFMATAAGIVSCNEKLNIAAPYKNITVVYGLLNQADTAHYIRIQKAFMDENQSAIDMAKVSDSSFYNSLAVVIKEFGPSGNLIGAPIPLTKVDLITEGYPKDAGAFFNTPSYAYKFKHTLEPQNQYRLVITNTNTGDLDSASTPIINNRDTNYFGIIEWKSGAAQKISFPRTVTGDGKLIAVSYDVNIPANVGIAQLILRFNWVDSNIATGASVHKSADFSSFSQVKQIEPSTSRNQTFTVSAATRNVYDFLRNALGAAPAANQYRYFSGCDMILYAGGIEYKRYVDLNSNKGGLTADEIRPVYTNIKGSDVMGLFSTRTFAQKLHIPLSNDTRDSLLNNVLTKDLNIRFLP